MIDNVFELEMDAPRPGVNDVTVNGVSVVHSGNVAEIDNIVDVTVNGTSVVNAENIAEIPAIPEYDSAKHALTTGTRTEGSTVGDYSVSEGFDVVASGLRSHAEGYRTTASGNDAVSEGAHTSALGHNSHAEGFSTIANHASQHVFGSYNIPDDSTAPASLEGNYIEIVGNGHNSLARSNARTLDWDGNEWLAGGLELAGTTSDVVLSGTNQTWDGTNTSLKDTISDLKNQINLMGQFLPNGIVIEQNISLAVGESATVHALTNPPNAQGVIWQTGDGEIAALGDCGDSYGTVWGVSAGTTTLTAAITIGETLYQTHCDVIVTNS